MTALNLINESLGKLGEPAVSSITSSGTAITHAKRIFIHAMHDMITQGQWPFAKTRAVIPQAADQSPADISSYGFVYDIPEDCLEVLQLLPTNYEYEMEGGLIYTDAPLSYSDAPTNEVQDYPRLVYLKKVVTEHEEGYPVLSSTVTFKDQFLSAFTARMAYELSLPVKKNLQLKQMFAQEYTGLLQGALGDVYRETPGNSEMPSETWGG